MLRLIASGAGGRSLLMRLEVADRRSSLGAWAGMAPEG